MICRKCGKQNDSESVFCGFCGSNMSENFEESKVRETESIVREKSNGVKALTIINIVISIGLIILAVSLFFRPCDGWSCLGSVLGAIFVIFIVFAIWGIYGIILSVRDSHKLAKTNKDFKKLRNVMLIFGVAPIIIFSILEIWIEASSSVMGFSSVGLSGVLIIVFLMIFRFAIPLSAVYLAVRNTLLKKKVTVLSVLLIIIFAPILIYMYIGSIYSIYEGFKSNKEYGLNKSSNYSLQEMVASACYGPFDEIYSIDDYEKSGIFECNSTKYSYYIKKNSGKCGYYDCGNIYEIGYSYHEKIESQFENGIYFYRESGVVGYPSELKIALEAESEEDLLNKYGEKLYNLAKDGDFDIVVYYNDTLDGVATTYDKLSLLVFIYENNVTTPEGMGLERGNFVFYYTNPDETLSMLFSDKNNYPENMRNAIKYHRHIKFESNGRKFENYDEFIEELKNSFEDGI